MRVLHVGKYFPPFHGGIENFLADLMRAQAAAGLEVAALVHHHEWGRRARVEDWHGLRIYRAPTYGRLLFVPLSPLFARHLDRVVREFQPDLLHLHLPNVSAFWPLLLPACRHLPWVVHWHSDVVASQHHRGLAAAYRFYAPLEQRLLAGAARVVVTSPPYLAESRALAAWRGKCEVVPLGIGDRDESLADGEGRWTPAQGRGDGGARAERWFGSSGDGAFRSGGYGQRLCRVLCIGRLTYYKGQELLIRAAARVPGVEVLIVGRGDLAGRLRRLIDELGCGERVRLAGELPRVELDAALQACDCVCLPSIERTEAFGLVLLEAMRAGKACIVSDVAGSGMSWVVRNGETGLVVRAGDAEDLAQALVFSREHPQRLAAMGEAGQRRFRELFSIEAVAARTSALYTELR